MQGRVVFTDAARFPKGISEGVSTLSTLKADLNTWLKTPADTSELPDAWGNIKAAARTDRHIRQAHLAALHARHGRDRRRPLAWGLLAVAALWLAVLLILNHPPLSGGFVGAQAGPARSAHPVARPGC